MTGNDPHDPLAHPATETPAPAPFHVGHRRGWRRMRGRPLLTLDATGVTSHPDHLTIPWTTLTHVRVDPGPVVVFGPITVYAGDLGVDLEELLTAVHRYTEAPIHQRYGGR